MNKYKGTFKLFNLIQSIINPDEVLEFEYYNNMMCFKTTSYDIRIIYDNINISNQSSAIRFRDASTGYEESMVFKLKDYDSSVYFNNAISMNIILSKDDIQRIVDECMNIEFKTYTIIETLYRNNHV